MPIGATGGDGRGAVDAAGRPAGGRCGGGSCAAGRGGLIPGAGEYDALEIEPRPAAQATEWALGSRTRAVRGGATRRGDGAPGGRHDGRLPRWGDGPDEGGGADTKAPGGPGARQAYLRSGGLPRGGVWDVEFL